MMLLSKEIKAKLPGLYAQEAEGEDAIAYVKFFDPCGSWNWFCTEFDGEDTFFGLVQGHEEELGYFSLSEIQSIQGPLGIGIERDRHFKPTRLRDIRKGS